LNGVRENAIAALGYPPFNPPGGFIAALYAGLGGSAGLFDRIITDGPANEPDDLGLLVVILGWIISGDRGRTVVAVWLEVVVTRGSWVFWRGYNRILAWLNTLIS
jgi:hypothetical protein